VIHVARPKWRQQGRLQTTCGNCSIFVRHGFGGMRKRPQLVIPKGGVCPRNLLFLESGEEKQIPRFARDDKKHFFSNGFRGCGKSRLQKEFSSTGTLPVRSSKHLAHPQSHLSQKAHRQSACATFSAASLAAGLLEIELAHVLFSLPVFARGLDSTRQAEACPTKLRTRILLPRLAGSF